MPYDAYKLRSTSLVDGAIADPTRLSVALQLSLTSGDVSLVAAKRYLQHSTQRQKVIDSLTPENCYAFLELLEDVAKSLNGEGIIDIDDLCISIARLPEQAVFLDRTKTPSFIDLSAESAALRAITMLLKPCEANRMAALAERIAKDQKALSCAAKILNWSYAPQKQQHDWEQFILPENVRKGILQVFSSNVLSAARENQPFQMQSPSWILWTLARVLPNGCPEVYAAIKKEQLSLDDFALNFLDHDWDSINGQKYSLPTDTSLHSVYCSIEEFKMDATSRLNDNTLAGC